MWAPPTSAATTKFGAASWILAMVEPKSETSSGKKLVARICPSLLDVVRHPFGGDLAVVVVGGQHVDLVAPLLHRIVDDRLDRLRRRRAGDEAIAIADAALIEDIVEIERVAAAERLPDRFAGRRGDAGMRRIDLVLTHELLSVFGVERDIRLAVVLLELDLAPEQTAGGVDFLDGQRIRHHDRLAVNVEHAGIILDAAELDRRILRMDAEERHASQHCGRAGGIEQGPAGDHESVSFGFSDLGKPVQSLFATFSVASFLLSDLFFDNGGAGRRDGGSEVQPDRIRRCCAAPEAAAPCRECCPSPD